MRPKRTSFLIGLFLVAQCLLISQAYSATEDYVTLRAPNEVKPFLLSDQYNQPFGLERLKNHWSLVFIGFTTCPDVCPVTLANLEAVRAEMGLRLSPGLIPRILFLAVDPDRDIPVLKDYLAYFHPEYIGLTGEVSQIDNLIKSLNAFYRLDKKTPDDSEYDVLHTAFVSVINPRGEMVAKLNPPFHPHRTGDYLIQLIRGVQFDD
jgi:protein SCO1/2